MCYYKLFSYTLAWFDHIEEFLMTTFVLKKYEEQKPVEGATETGVANPPKETEETTIEIQASDTIAKIVATALYKALPNNVQVEEKEDTTSTTNVVSTEDINSNPSGCLKKLPNGSTVMIVNEGFRTEKEEWFLSSLGNKNVNVFYSLESFIKHVKTKLGV